MRSNVLSEESYTCAAETALSLRDVKLKPLREDELQGLNNPTAGDTGFPAEETTLWPDIIIFKPLAKGLRLGALAS
jgi:hypothetical protein